MFQCTGVHVSVCVCMSMRISLDVCSCIREYLYIYTYLRIYLFIFKCFNISFPSGGYDYNEFDYIKSSSRVYRLQKHEARVAHNTCFVCHCVGAWDWWSGHGHVKFEESFSTRRDGHNAELAGATTNSEQAAHYRRPKAL